MPVTESQKKREIARVKVGPKVVIKMKNPEIKIKTKPN